MTSSVVMGDFNSEKYWRDDGLSNLPFIEDHSNAGMIFAMDELLFPFCQKKDLLITRFAFDAVLKDYLQMLGFEFKCNQRDFHTQPEDETKSIFEIIVRDEGKFGDFITNCKDCSNFTPYSILPYADVLAKKSQLQSCLPFYETVKKVNSKTYSTLLSRKLGLGTHSEIIYSSSDLMTVGRRFLKQGPFLIKDLYGVSGKGNLLIHSIRLLERIAKYLEAEESKGKCSNFIIERFLDKKMDFSCGLIIQEDGRMEIISIQKMLNQQFAYSGSKTAGETFCSFLRERNYFDTMAEVARELYQNGYFGPVCVDSMLLKTGEIVPIIEINARYSMGFINCQIDSHLAKFGLKGNLIKIDLGITGPLTFEAILAQLADKKVLFFKGQESGVLPLSSNTLLRNQRSGEKIWKSQMAKGRMYFSVIAPDDFRKAAVLEETQAAFEELACKIYSKV